MKKYARKNANKYAVLASHSDSDLGYDEREEQWLQTAEPTYSMVDTPYTIIDMLNKITTIPAATTEKSSTPILYLDLESINPSRYGTVSISHLESPSYTKVFFDVRNDSDALYAHFRVRLAGVEDPAADGKRGPGDNLPTISSRPAEVYWVTEHVLEATAPMKSHQKQRLLSVRTGEVRFIRGL
ncbi:hypothetical protein B0H66DRAFT_605242 [Apodospora peruviana]|uniref:Uncharacterized protein n=1 Tax=Apodospora peruviana TaxID=516989 RepID=A0AAE0I1N8_9PEZI|nr:hypothetical protein B0H66DRAFT_605242 [Apodospora peruviana]